MSINLIKSFFFSTAQAPTYPLVQATMPQPTASTPTTTSTNEPAKSSAKTKNKKFAFDGLSRSAIIAQLKQQWKDEEEEEAANVDLDDDQESKASSVAFVANNPYYPYIQELFGHDKNSTPDLGED